MKLKTARREERKTTAAKPSRETLFYRISVATHPLFWVIIALLAFYQFPVHASGLYRSVELFAGIVLFAVLPFALLYRPVKRKEITINLEDQEKRNKFFLPWGAIFASAFLFYSNFNARPHAALALSFFASMMLLHFVNRRSKISWHAMGLSMVSIALAYYYGTIGLVLLATLVPLACLARLKLKAHTPFQLAAGAACGIAIALASLALA